MMQRREGFFPDQARQHGFPEQPMTFEGVSADEISKATFKALQGLEVQRRYETGETPKMTIRLSLHEYRKQQLLIMS